MKKFVFIIAIALLLTGCFATARAILSDQMGTEQEVVRHAQTECEYWNRDAKTCGEWTESLVKLWKAHELAGTELDADVIRQWAKARIIESFE